METPDESRRDRVGDEAEEWVSGSWAESGALHLDGIRTSDTTLVNPDHYDLRVSPAGVVSGRSESDGGRVSARVAR